MCVHDQTALTRLRRPQILEQDPPSTCTYFINCFHVQSGIGLRKFYLGFQGALLGAWLDMFQFEQMKKFTTMLTVRGVA